MKYNINKSVVALVASLIIPLLSLAESVLDSLNTKSPGWYIGAEGGVAIGYSTFDSSGDGTLKPGWTTGVFGGYRFNALLSAEVSLKYARLTLTPQYCCVRQDYWLGSDGGWYGAPVLGMETWNYAELKSQVTVGQYGARFNFNVLGLFGNIRKSRWSFNISPQVYAISSKAEIQTAKGGVTVFRPSTKWHFGGGFNVSPSVRLAHSIVLGAYTGFTFITGNRIDGMPKHLHINNMIWDSGVKFICSIPTRTTRTKAEEPANIAISVPEVVSLPDTTVSLVPKPEVTDPDTVHVPMNKVEEKPDTVASQPQAETELPAIYFDFNKYLLRQEELPKLRVILKYLKDNPDVKVTMQGWCDTRGPVYVNSRLSRLRAARVKSWFVKHGVAASRMSVVGNGSDFKMINHAKARRVVTEKTVNP